MIRGGNLNRRLAAAATALVVAMAGAVSGASPARAADVPITDIGIAPGAVINGPIQFRPTVADGADIRSIRINAETDRFGDLSQGSYSAPWDLYWDPLYFRGEDVRLSLVAVDSAGRWTRTEPITVYVDRTGPSYQIDNPAQPGWEWYVSVRRPIRISATDRAGVNRVELLQNGRLVRTVELGDSPAGTASLPLDPATKNGPVTMTIRLVDRFGNVAFNDFGIIVDNDPPTGTFLPSATYLRSTFTAMPYTEHDNVWVQSMSSYLDDHKGGGVTDRHPLSVRVDSRVVKNGRHTLSFELTDVAGNTGVVRRTVYIDNLVPAITLTAAPRNNSKLTKSVTIKARASDGYGVGLVQMLVNGKAVATDRTAGYQFSLNPKKYGKTFTVQLRVYDRAGNVRYTSKLTYRR